MRDIRLRVFLIAGLSTLFLGCTLIALRPTEEASTPTLPAPSATLTPTKTPAPTPTPSPLPSPTADPCPARQSVAFPDLPSTFPDGYVEALRSYLAQGGEPAALQAGLRAWDVLPPEPDSGPLWGDLTGDGVTETVAAFINAQAEIFPPPGALAIFACRDGTVETLASYAPGIASFTWPLGIADLTEDGVSDLAFADVNCGAHTCWFTVRVWAWTDGQFQEQVEGDFSLPYAGFKIEDGQIHGYSAGMGSVGAGPQRPYTETWRWNGEVITFATEEVGPPRFRYHAFQDGDQALYVEDYDAAFDAYLRVINDDDLDPWAGLYDTYEEQRWLTALAQWRLLTMGMHLGNFPDAEMRYERLQMDYPPDTPGYPVAVLAERFWSQYQETGNVAYGCIEAVNAPEVEAVLSFLNSFGYANPTYAAEDLCPFLTP